MNKLTNNHALHTLAGALVALGWLGSAAEAATISLSGANASGYAALSGVKASSSQADAEAWNFPYYVDTDGLFQSIAATPLSSTSVYAEESTYSVYGKDVDAPEFATFSAGTISYDAAALTGVGTEVVGVSALTLAINSDGFSPYSSGYNTGSGIGDFPFNYSITASNFTGNGLTFVNGQLMSIDLDADIAVAVQFAETGFYFTDLDSGDTALYEGDLSISATSYAFDLDVTQDVGSIVGTLEDTRLVLNRAGYIDAVTTIPVPAAAPLLMSAMGVLGWFGRRRRSSLRS